MKNILHLFIIIIVCLIVFLVTIPFKLISMLWFWEGINDYTCSRSLNSYTDSIAEMAVTITHQKN